MKISICLIGLLCVLAGCSQQNDPRVEQLQNTVTQLSNTVSILSKKVDGTLFLLNVVSSNEDDIVNQCNANSTDISNITASVQYLWFVQRVTATNVANLMVIDGQLNSPYGSAPVDPQHNGYFNLKTPYGVLLIKTDSVEQYLDGFKIHLSIGNPTSASFNGFSLICSAYDSTNYMQTVHSITNDMTDVLTAGNWNKINFVLAPATMDEVRNASISVQLNSLTLYTPPTPQ